MKSSISMRTHVHRERVDEAPRAFIMRDGVKLGFHGLRLPSVERLPVWTVRA
jgi:hypothetical protein